MFAVYETATGKLVSVGSVLGAPLDASLTAVDLGVTPADSQMWDAASRTFVSRPAKVLIDRFDDLIADPRFSTAWLAMTLTLQASVKAAITDLLGRKRFRSSTTPVNI